MRIAVSGSSGFVGSSLTAVLKEAGHELLVLSRPGSSEVASADNSTEWIPEVGLTSPAALDDCDAFIHLAGKSIASGRWSEKLKGEIRSSRVDATRILAHQLTRLSSPPKTIISASAIGIYGDCGDAWVDEASPAASSFLAEVAQDWEAACDPFRDAGLRVCHPRLGMVLDDNGGAMEKVVPLFKGFLGGRLGNGRQWWSWVSLRDCVRALTWMLENQAASGAYNVVAPNPVTNREFTEALGQALNRPTILPVPATALRLALGEMADALLLTSCRVAPKRLKEAEFQFENPELANFFAEHVSN